MNNTKIIIPPEMLFAAWKRVAVKMKELAGDRKRNAHTEFYVARLAVEGALEWLSENPMAPTDNQISVIYNFACRNFGGTDKQLRYQLMEWQRQMFLPVEPDVPEELRDVLSDNPKDWAIFMSTDNFNNKLIEAFNRGRKAGDK